MATKYDVALSVDCPFCGAIHGYPCRRPSSYGNLYGTSYDTSYRRTFVHRDRFAKGMSEGVLHESYERGHNSGYEGGFADGYEKALEKIKQVLAASEAEGDKWIFAREATIRKKKGQAPDRVDTGTVVELGALAPWEIELLGRCTEASDTTPQRPTAVVDGRL